MDEWREWSHPDNELPASAALDVVLARTDDLVVFVSGLTVYRRGFAFTVQARVRRSAGEETLFNAMSDDHSAGGGLLLGVRFADGRRGVTHGWALGDRAVRVIAGGSAASTRSVEGDYFVSPLPPPGDVTFAVTWPNQGVAETLARIDAAPILQAAERASELWPWEAYEPDVEPPDKWLPDGLESGWFGHPPAGNDAD